jgi:hypothetical protein
MKAARNCQGGLYQETRTFLKSKSIWKPGLIEAQQNFTVSIHDPGLTTKKIRLTFQSDGLPKL